MPMNKSKYPANWPEISARIRARAGNRCEQCGVTNGVIILRSVEDPERYVILEDNGIHSFPDGTPVRSRLEMLPEEYDLNEKYTKIVLTVAHLNHDTMDNRDENLACLCQLHHLRYDATHHAETRRRNRDRKVGQLELF